MLFFSSMQNVYKCVYDEYKNSFLLFIFLIDIINSMLVTQKKERTTPTDKTKRENIIHVADIRMRTGKTELFFSFLFSLILCI